MRPSEGEEERAGGPSDWKLTLPRPAPADAGRLAVLRGRVLDRVGRLARAVGMPGAIRSCDIFDEATGQRLTVTVSALFTRVAVNGREYYFRRWTGEYDGAGACRL